MLLKFRAADYGLGGGSSGMIRKPVAEERKNLGLMIKMVDDAIAKRANNEMRGLGVTVMQSRLLLELYRRGDDMQLPLKELERSFGVAQATIAGLVSRMEEKGLLEMLPNPHDRRAKLAHLTEAGVGICQTVNESIETGEKHIRSGLTKAEAEELERLLGIVYETVK